jgi:hypothetical protein
VTVQIELSKLNTYNVLAQTDERVAKLNTYNVLAQKDIRVSKLVSYIVLAPGSTAPSTLPPARNRLRYELPKPTAVTKPRSRQLAQTAILVFPQVNIAQVNRRSLISATTKPALVVDQVTRRNLVSGGATNSVRLRVAGITRKILALSNPPLTPLFANGPIPLFPTLPEGFPLRISPVLDTVIGTTKSLREMRVPLQVYPIWDIELLFEELRDQTQNQTVYAPFAGYQEYMELVQTWLMMYGQTGVFAFNCPWDNSRTDQAIGVGDGVTLGFVAYRTWGQGTLATLAPVGAINAITAVYFNGSAVSPATYTVQRNALVFVDPPAAGVVITMTFSYYYLCRFVEDEQDFEEWSKNRWAVKSLKIRAAPW